MSVVEGLRTYGSPRRNNRDPKLQVSAVEGCPLGGCEVLACIWFGLVMWLWVMYLVCFCYAFVRMRISHLSVHIFGCTPFYSSCEHLLNSH